MGRFKPSWEGGWKAVKLESKLTAATLTTSHICQDPDYLVFKSTETMRTYIYMDYAELIWKEECFDRDLQIASCEGPKKVG